MHIALRSGSGGTASVRRTGTRALIWVAFTVLAGLAWYVSSHAAPPPVSDDFARRVDVFLAAPPAEFHGLGSPDRHVRPANPPLTPVARNGDFVLAVGVDGHTWVVATDHTEDEDLDQAIDPSHWLPAWRWDDHTPIKTDLGFFDGVQKAIAAFCLVLFVIAAKIWQIITTLFWAATSSDLLTSAARRIDDAYYTLTDRVRESGLVIIVFAAALIVAARYALKSDLAKIFALILTFVVPIAAMYTFANTASGASRPKGNADDYQPAVGSPSWLAIEGNNLLNDIGGRISYGFGVINDRISSSGLWGNADTGANCQTYTQALVRRYQEATGQAQDLNAARRDSMITLSEIWTRSYLAMWSQAQFGNGAYASRIACHDVEMNAKVPVSERVSLLQEAGYRISDNSDHQREFAERRDGEDESQLFGFAACSPDDSGKWQIDLAWAAMGKAYEYSDGEAVACRNWAENGVARSNGGTRFEWSDKDALNAPLEDHLDHDFCTSGLPGSRGPDGADLVDRSYADVVSANWNAWIEDWVPFTGEGDTQNQLEKLARLGLSGPVAVARSTWDAAWGFITNSNGARETNVCVASPELKEQMRSVRDTVLAYWGHNTAEKMAAGVLVLVTAVIYAWALGGLAVGTLIAQVGLIVMLILLPATLLMLAMPSQTAKRNPIGVRLLRTTAGFLAAKLLLLIVMVLLLQIIQTIELLLDNPSSYWQMIIPLVALFVVRKLLKVAGLGNLTSLSGAVGMATSAALGIGGGTGGQLFSRKTANRTSETFGRAGLGARQLRRRALRGVDATAWGRLARRRGAAAGPVPSRAHGRARRYAELLDRMQQAPKGSLRERLANSRLGRRISDRRYDDEGNLIGFSGFGWRGRHDAASARAVRERGMAYTRDRMQMTSEERARADLHQAALEAASRAQATHAGQRAYLHDTPNGPVVNADPTGGRPLYGYVDPATGQTLGMNELGEPTRDGRPVSLAEVRAITDYGEWVTRPEVLANTLTTASTFFGVKRDALVLDPATGTVMPRVSAVVDKDASPAQQAAFLASGAAFLPAHYAARIQAYPDHVQAEAMRQIAKHAGTLTDEGVFADVGAAVGIDPGTERWREEIARFNAGQPSAFDAIRPQLSDETFQQIFTDCDALEVERSRQLAAEAIDFSVRAQREQLEDVLAAEAAVRAAMASARTHFDGLTAALAARARGFAELERIGHDLARVREEEATAAAALAQLEDTQSALRQQLLSVDADPDRVTQELAAAQARAADEQTRAADLAARRAELAARHAAHRSELEELTDRVYEHLRGVNAAQTAAGDVQAGLAAISAEARMLQERLAFVDGTRTDAAPTASEVEAAVGAAAAERRRELERQHAEMDRMLHDAVERNDVEGVRELLRRELELAQAGLARSEEVRREVLASNEALVSYVREWEAARATAQARYDTTVVASADDRFPHRPFPG